MSSCFVTNTDINNIICINYEDSIVKIKTDCVICLYDGSISRQNASKSTKAILKLAGNDLISELNKKTNLNSRSSPDDILVTDAYNFAQARFLLHVVAPLFVPKYASASYTKLHNTYQSVLSRALELETSSLLIPCLHRARRGFFGRDGAIIALRTIRRYLEKVHADCFLKRVTLVVMMQADQDIYKELYPIYFPRNAEEEILSSNLSQNLIGGLNGEMIIDDRLIRIQSSIPKCRSEDNLTTSYKKENPINHSFLKMEQNFDRERIMSLRRQKPQLTKKKPQPLPLPTYQSETTQFKSDHYDQYSNPRLLYRGGRDIKGREVVVFVASHFSGTLSRSFFEWFVHRMADIVDGAYAILYLNTGAGWLPTGECLRRLLSRLDERYLSNLECVYALHVGRAEKVKCWLNLPKPIYSKLMFLKGVEFVYGHIPCGQITFPTHVLDHDFKVNGLRYYLGPVADALSQRTTCNVPSGPTH